ncbi:MAG: winged helix-turn-helix transcriptional regulator [Candidatus Bathyarchaeota archaeon]|nr:MAG: winged helix-turn-helix transcriptional regulator [Candidatus Bathyarchaeota archaeon]
MMTLKDIDLKIIFELMKNSKTSDRQLANKLGVSQPTITRRRGRLEDGAIEGYTTIPAWKEIGYEIFAITLYSINQDIGLQSKAKTSRKRAKEWLMSHPNVIMGGGGRGGAGMEGFMITIHKNYSDFESFMVRHRREVGDLVNSQQTFVVNLGGSLVLKPFHLKYLADAP